MEREEEEEEENYEEEEGREEDEEQRAAEEPLSSNSFSNCFFSIECRLLNSSDYRLQPFASLRCCLSLSSPLFTLSHVVWFDYTHLAFTVCNASHSQLAVCTHAASVSVSVSLLVLVRVFLAPLLEFFCLLCRMNLYFAFTLHFSCLCLCLLAIFRGCFLALLLFCGLLRLLLPLPLSLLLAHIALLRFLCTCGTFYCSFLCVSRFFSACISYLVSRFACNRFDTRVRF